ncbi:hypothetical protein [Sorangium sp. So ce590]|uniref:hypothetical protein n=1 Tax=unclassified Sorangium TaxID=2621164 RepID=UPI003F63EDA2
MGSELRKEARETDLGQDLAHDLAHFTRVVASAKALSADERARPGIFVPAAWLHDRVNIPKNGPRRSQASRLSAEEALRFLRRIDSPEGLLADIAHAIEATGTASESSPGAV